ncbi:MAG TPA: hypothetical protein PKI03_39575 [Pseudomonadota bacterium]|nr:hypothetical protein [Pseudomonadota bacterium]
MPRALCWLAILGLSGCNEELTWMRVGMLCAPLSHAFAVLTVLGLEGAWAFRGHAVAKRRQVLAAPAILLGLAGLWLLATLSPPDRAAVLQVIGNRGWLMATAFSSIPLAALQMLCFRLWFALRPQYSVEGSTLLVSALFYAPGLAITSGLITARETIDSIVGTFIVGCIYGVFVAAAVFAILGLESTWAKRRAAHRP